MDWIVDVLAQWVEEARPACSHADSSALWPSERGPRIGFSQMNTRFAAYREAIGLAPGLDTGRTKR
jgi:hypothetical protein